MLGIIILIIIFIHVVLIKFYIFMDPENFIPADSLVHIQSEWYFLSTYTILRSIPNKLEGVIGLFVRIIILFILLWLSKNLYSSPSLYALNEVVF